MRVLIDVGGVYDATRIHRLARYGLAAASTQVRDVRLRVEPWIDPRGALLVRCRASVRLRNGEEVRVEDIQPLPDRAVTRALERALRASRRRRAT